MIPPGGRGRGRVGAPGQTTAATDTDSSSSPGPLSRAAPGGGNSRFQGRHNAQTIAPGYKDARAREPRRVRGRGSGSLGFALLQRGSLPPVDATHVHVRVQGVPRIVGRHYNGNMNCLNRLFKPQNITFLASKGSHSVE